MLNRFTRCRSGATSIEYGLIAALIAVAAITAMQGLGATSRSADQALAERCDRYITDLEVEQLAPPECRELWARLARR